MESLNNLGLSSEHKLLLQAALQEGEKAINAWPQWINTVNIENLDNESYFLLPVLYPNLVKHEVKHPEITRIKGVYKRNWYNNQLQVTTLTTILNSFAEANLNSFVLGDLALATNYYSDLGMRPIHAIELLVSSEDAVIAFQLLRHLGWQSKVDLTPKFMAFYPKIGLVNNSGKRCHLYWRYWGESFSKNEFLKYACNTQINGVSTYIFKPEQQLLGICWQGCISESNFLVPWVADAQQILRLYEHQINWEYLIKKGKSYSLLVPLIMLLNSLEQIFQLPLKVTQELGEKKLKETQIEAIEKSLGRFDKIPIPIYVKLNRKIISYLRLADRQKFPLTILGFLKYLHATTAGNRSKFRI
jgi:hypothetical protein